jgi:hypothetical protein
METNLRVVIGPRQVGIFLMGLILVAYGAIGLWGLEVSSQNVFLILLVAGVTLAVVLFWSRMS